MSIRAEQTCLRLRGEETARRPNLLGGVRGRSQEKGLRAELWQRIDAGEEEVTSLEAVRAELRGSRLRDDDAARATYGHDESDQGDFPPELVVFPRTQQRGAAGEWACHLHRTPSRQ